MSDATTTDTSSPDTAAGEPKFELSVSRQFIGWLAEQRASLAFTTHQTGKLFLIGLRPDGRVSVFERTFSRCMGPWANAETMHMSSLYPLWRFENALDAGQVHDDYDRLYAPQIGYTTGDLDIHDVAVGSGGRLRELALPGRARAMTLALHIHPNSGFL